MILEWLAFGGSLVSVYLYGKSGTYGPISGLVTCVLFMAFGYSEGLYAAIFSNFIFMAIHAKNLRSAIMDDQEKLKRKIVSFFTSFGKVVMPDRLTAKWWNNNLDGQSPEYFHQIALKLGLVHSEVSEALEHHRTSFIDEQTGKVIWSPDKKLPHLPGLACELSDIVLRVIEIAEANELPLGQALAEKLIYNKSRPDHDPNNMAKPGGKRY